MIFIQLQKFIVVLHVFLAAVLDSIRGSCNATPLDPFNEMTVAAELGKVVRLKINSTVDTGKSIVGPHCKETSKDYIDSASPSKVSASAYILYHSTQYPLHTITKVDYTGTPDS